MFSNAKKTTLFFQKEDNNMLMMKRIEVTYDNGLFKAYPGVSAKTVETSKDDKSLAFSFIGSDREDNDWHNAIINLDHVLFIEISDEEDMED